MWENLERRRAEFRANGWKLAVATAEQGVQLVAGREGLAASSARIWLPESCFADCRESFIRGDALHLSLSDTDTQPLGLDLVLMAIEADEHLLILETVIAVRTSLLDSHPAVELQFGAGDLKHPHWGDSPWMVGDEGTALWLQAQPGEGPQISAHVLCDDRDRLSLDTPALTGAGRLRFFGDFLEKGVIRKVQPWWVWSHGPISPRVVARIAGQMAGRPLPLTN